MNGIIVYIIAYGHRPLSGELLFEHCRLEWNGAQILCCEHDSIPWLFNIKIRNELKLNSENIAMVIVGV